MIVEEYLAVVEHVTGADAAGTAQPFTGFAAGIRGNYETQRILIVDRHAPAADVDPGIGRFGRRGQNVIVIGKRPVADANAVGPERRLPDARIRFDVLELRRRRTDLGTEPRRRRPAMD